MADLYFEDFALGDRFETAAETVTEADIITFARAYDPQPFHIDPEAAARTRFGGLIASGFHTLAVSFGLFFRTRILEAANLGSPGIDEVRWLRPVRPGDTLRMEAEVCRIRPSRSKPDRGVVWMDHRVFNQRGELVMTVRCMHMLRRREAEATRSAAAEAAD